MLEAVRLWRYEMAVSDFFGTNLFDVALLLVADAFFAGDAILTIAGTFSLAAALLGIAVTTIFLAGLIERKNVAIARTGLDSVGVLVTYLVGTPSDTPPRSTDEKPHLRVGAGQGKDVSQAASRPR